MTTEILRALEGDTVDLLVWRRHGSVPGLVEDTLALNPGLAGGSIVLPVGHPVVVPLPPQPRLLPAVNLWD